MPTSLAIFLGASPWPLPLAVFPGRFSWPFFLVLFSLFIGPVAELGAIYISNACRGLTTINPEDPRVDLEVDPNKSLRVTRRCQSMGHGACLPQPPAIGGAMGGPSAQRPLPCG